MDGLNHALEMGYSISDIQELVSKGIKSGDLALLQPKEAASSEPPDEPEKASQPTAKKRDAIPLSFDHYGRIMRLSLKERGVVMTALFEHFVTGQVNPAGDCANMNDKCWLVFDAMVGQVDRFTAISAARSEAGKKGGAPTGNKNAARS